MPPVPNNTAEAQATFGDWAKAAKECFPLVNQRTEAKDKNVNNPRQKMTFQDEASAKRMSRASKLMATTPAPTISKPVFRSLASVWALVSVLRSTL
jgi:hypothetical protein